MFLQIAEDEAKTLKEYSDMLNDIEDMDKGTKSIVNEILTDEFNHCLIALLMASTDMGVKIGTDELSEDPNDIEVTD